MKRLTLILLGAVACVMPAAAQNRVFRSEFVPYETRETSNDRDRESTERYQPLLPDKVIELGELKAIHSRLQVPTSWSDSDIFIHLENVGAAYTLMVNGQVAAKCEDSYTPAEFLISPYVEEGANEILIVLRGSSVAHLQKNLPLPTRNSLSNSYVISQRRVGIRDYEVELRPDSLKRFGVLDLRVIVGNGYNYDEPLTVGYDIYSPQGKLLEYSVNDITVKGRSLDTLRFSPYIYHTYENKWADGKAPLYQLTLYIKVGGILREYIPMQIGFGKTEVVDGKLMRFDKPLDIRAERYNALSEEVTVRREVAQLKAKGINTLRPDYPQPDWFYTVCDELGMMVIDRAAINAPDDRDNRKKEGTPSNDPQYLNEYLERVKSMYTRSRNHTCVIAFELGSPSGNGYNMYKAYQWLKSVEKSRPVIYSDTDGEWNSDNIINLDF